MACFAATVASQLPSSKSPVLTSLDSVSLTMPRQFQGDGAFEKNSLGMSGTSVNSIDGLRMTPGKAALPQPAPSEGTVSEAKPAKDRFAHRVLIFETITQLFVIRCLCNVASEPAGGGK
jgi:hypothetical protein